jgi:hypothetical protein
MKKICLFTILTLSVFVFCLGCFERRDIPKSINGRTLNKIALTWLVKLDNGSYQQSYDEAAQFFKNNVDKNQWLANMQTYRAGAGVASKRKELNMFYYTEFPNTPAGEYVTIQYGTAFQQNTAAIETLTLIKEQDGTWKVAGYYIK